LPIAAMEILRSPMRLRVSDCLLLKGRRALRVVYYAALPRPDYATAEAHRPLSYWFGCQMDPCD
jgi:hypothetical protein